MLRISLLIPTVLLFFSYIAMAAPPLKDIYEGPNGSYPEPIVAVGESVFFIAYNNVTGSELYASDGTSAGTDLTRDIFPGPGSARIGDLTEIGGNRVYFRANDGSNGSELWQSDGTLAGTNMLVDLNPGSAGSNPVEFTQVGTDIFFSAYDSTNGRELWKTDGTAGGTQLVKDIAPGLNSSDPQDLIAYNNALYFRTSANIADGSGGELWVSDGTDKGTEMVKDINPISGASNPRGFTISSNILYFRADDGVNGTELWGSDGTTKGTSLIADINPGSGSSFPGELTDLNGVLYFTATESLTGRELWKSDGTNLGTLLVADINSASTSNPESLLVVSGILFFSANDGMNGRELWSHSTNGQGNTSLVKDINPGAQSSYPFNLTDSGGTLVFTADDGTNGSELWTSNGGVLDTHMINNPRADVSSEPAELTSNLANTLFYSADEDDQFGAELYYISDLAALTKQATQTSRIERVMRKSRTRQASAKFR